MAPHSNDVSQQPSQQEGVVVVSPTPQDIPFHQKFFQKFRTIDRFATTPSLNYRGSKHYTFVGVTLSALIYAFIFGYLVYKLNEAFTDPEITSYTLVGQLEDELDFSDIVICLDDSLSTFNSNVDVNTVFYVSNYPQLTFKRTYRTGMTTGICGMFVGDSSTNTNYPIDIGVNHSKFSANSVTYNIFYDYIAFDADKIEVPRITSRKSYVQNKASLQSFKVNFEKAQYKINTSPLSTSSEKYDCPIFNSVEQNFVSNSLAVIQLRYVASKTVYKIKCNTIPSVLSAIVGLLETFTFIIALFLGGFFEIKYYENLANSFKPADQKLKGGFWAYVDRRKKNAHKKVVFDEIKKEQEFIDSKLDVMTYLSSHIKERDIELYKTGNYQ